MANPAQVTPSPGACSAPSLVYSSDFTIKALSIITSTGAVIDIKRMAIETNLYEDLFSPTMSGNILIGDALDLITNYQIHGNEYLVLELDKPTLNMPISKVFRIYKVADRNLDDPTTANYMLYFMSEEGFISTQHVLCKSYHGMAISDMIKDVLLNQLGCNPKKINYWDTTQGNFNIIVPRMYGMEAIEWLSTRAYSSNGSVFFFWENRDGYNFRALESIMGDAVYQNYFRSPKTDSNPANTINSFNTLTVLQDFDVLNSNRYGAYNSTLLTLDLVNQQYLNSSLTYGQFPMLNPALPVNGATNRFNEPLTSHPDSFIKFYPSTDGDPTTNAAHPANWLHRKAMRVAQLHTYRMVGALPGDVMLKSGCCVGVQVPMIMPQGTAPSLNFQRTAKYLVSAVHHTFRNDQMVSIVELLSDSVMIALSAPNNTSAGLIAAKSA